MIWLENLEWCICILKRQIGLLEPGVCFLWRLQCWRFLQFQRLWRRCHPAGNSKVGKKIYFAFLVKRNQFCNYLGRGFNIPEMEINFLIQNHWSVFTEDTLLSNTKVSARALNARNDQVSIRPTSDLHNFRYWCISTCLLPFLCLMEYARWEKPKGSSTLLGLACILSDAQ